MKNGWEIRRFGDVCQFAKELGEWKNLPYVGLEDIESNSGRFLGSTSPQMVKSSTFRFTSEHVLYGRLRPYLNKVILPDFEGHCSTEIFPIRTSDELDKRYLFHWLRSEEIVTKINATWTGARMPRANMNQVLDFPIPVPPIEEQRRIVAILDEAFACIDKAKVNTEKNIQNAREFFDTYLNNMFSNPGPDWEQNSIDEIADVEYGFTDKGQDNGKYRYIRITDINAEGQLNNEGKVFIKASPEAKRFQLEQGDLLMARTGATYGKVLFFDGDEPSVFASYLIRIKFKREISNELYWYFSKSKLYWAQANSLMSGSAQPQFNGAALKRLRFVYPKAVKEQNKITKKMDEMWNESGDLENVLYQKLEYLEGMKKSILQKAFSGALRTS